SSNCASAILSSVIGSLSGWLKRRNSNPTGRTDGPRKGAANSNFYTTSRDTTRLIAQCLKSGRLRQRYTATATSHTRKFTPDDIVLLAELDSLHGTLSGPVTQVLLQRACHHFGQAAYPRLATISVSPLYNLRAKPLYQQRRVHFTKTQSRPSSIGIRRAPAPEGRLGSSASIPEHQGDHNGIKGLYHINAVDIVTQWEVSPLASASAKPTRYRSSANWWPASPS
ncbi:MAG: hypothetical protein ABIS17_07650, partial [Casimicrobiaceae bacterium]